MRGGRAAQATPPQVADPVAVGVSERARVDLVEDAVAPPRRGLDLALRIFAGSYLCAIVAGVVVYKAAFVEMLTIDPFFATYGLVVSAYIVSRFVISLFYRPGRPPGSSRTSRS